MQSFIIRNEHFEFWRGLRISSPAFAGELIHLWEARGHMPSDWKPLSVTTATNGVDIEVYFNRPCNAHHLRIDVSTQQAGALNFFPIKTERLSHESTLAMLATKKILFIGCARDCEQGAGRSLGILQALGQHFGECKIAIYENDSKDQTVKVLKDHQTRMNLTVISEQGLDQQMPARTHRLAYARNKLLAWALNQDSDYIAVVDMDTVLTDRFNPAGFINNFELESVWDAVFPVNEDFYYDLWALRKEKLIEGDYYLRMNGIDAALGVNQCRWLGAHSMQIDLRSASGWIDVDSAFGGMGIYKTKTLLRARPRYLGHDMAGAELCEHVPFNEELKRNGANLYINPKFVVGTTTIIPASEYLPGGIWEIFQRDPLSNNSS
jgi:hypothetical protein